MGTLAKNVFISALQRVLFNALIQPHFDYGCSTWCPNLISELRNKLQTTQNKCILLGINVKLATSINMSILWYSNVKSMFPDYLMKLLKLPQYQIKLRNTKAKSQVLQRNWWTSVFSFRNEVPELLKSFQYKDF